MNDSSPYSSASPPHYSTNGTPSPLTFQSSSCMESYSPPYSSTSATPSYDHMIPSSTPSQLPLLPQSVDPFMNQQTTPTMNHHHHHHVGGGPMPRKQMFATSSHMTSRGGHMTNLNSLSSTPSPSMEVRATFVPNANSTSNLTGYIESYSVPMTGTNMSNMFAMSDAEFSHKAIPSFAQAPPNVKQNIISARQRYSGAAPTGHAPSGAATISSHVVAGHHVRGSANNGGNADDSISQWTQWLQGSAPAPVC